MDIKEFLSEWNNDDDSIEVKTSGSTGTPKKMRVKKSRMLASARRTNDFFGLKKGDRTLLCMSLDYIAGKMMAVRAIERGLQMDVVEPCGHPLAHLPSFGKAEGGYDFIAMVPMQVWNTLHDEKERARLCETKQLLIGGGEISREMESLLAPLPCHSWSSYGMTETLSHIALRRIGSGLWYEPLSQVSLSLADDGCLIVNDEATGAFNMKTLPHTGKKGQCHLLWRHKDSGGGGGAHHCRPLHVAFHNYPQEGREVRRGGGDGYREYRTRGDRHCPKGVPRLPSKILAATRLHDCGETAENRDWEG